jgi:hypothetical protein
LLALATAAAGLSSNASSLTYIQIQCFDSKCSQDCDGGPIPQDTCVGSTGNGAAELKCLNETHLEEKLWDNPRCIGKPASTSILELNSCIKSSTGEFYENLCCEQNDPRRICTGPQQPGGEREEEEEWRMYRI